MKLLKLLLVTILFLNIWGSGINHQTENEFGDILKDEDQIPRFSNHNLNQYLADNNTWSDNPVDTNGNGLYDQLEVNLGSAEQINEDFYVYGILKSSSGSWIGYSSSNHPSYSTNDIILSFGGQSINASGLDGQYELWIATFVYYASEYNFSYAYTTNPYNHSDFEISDAIFTDFSDYGSDKDGDSLFEEIIIEASLNIRRTAQYTIALLLESDDPFEIESQSLIGQWSGYLNSGNQTVEISFSTNYLYSKRLNGPYTIGFAYIISDQGFQQFLTNTYNTSYYSYTDFKPPAAYLTGNYWDKGEDTDGDGKFNQLVIDVGVNVTKSGEYSLSLSLTPSNQTHLSISEYADGYWNVGVHNISLIIEDYEIFSQRLNTSYTVSYVRLYDQYNDLLDQTSNDYITNVYSYSEFDTPIAFITGRFWDSGVDSDTDGKFDEIKIDVEVNITQTGGYYLDIKTIANATNYNYYGSNFAYYNVGAHNFSVIIDVDSSYSERINTSYLIDYARISDSYHNTLDTLYPDFSTRVYNYLEFDPPEVFLTGKFMDNGLDTDADGKFNELEFGAEINVTQAGVYQLTFRLKGNDTYDTYYGYADGFLNTGVQNISVTINVPTYYSQRLNTSYIIDYVRIRDTYSNTLEIIYPNYFSRFYYYSEFDPPEVYLTGNYADEGLDTDADGKFNQLTIDIEVNVTQPGFYYLNLRTRDSINSNSYYHYSSGTWTEGLQNISMIIDVPTFYSQRLNASYNIEFLELLNSLHNKIEDHYPNTQTRVYSYIEFDPPGLFLTGNYWDEGLDTDGDGEFNQIILKAEVNITQSGEYYLDLSLRSSFSGTAYYGYTNGYWNIGLANISVSFDASNFFSSRVNQTYDLYRIDVFQSNVSFTETIFNAYTTRKYNYTEFDLPGAYFTGNFWDKGLDTDGDGTYDQLMWYVEVNVTEPGEYYLRLYWRFNYIGSSFTSSATTYLNPGLFNFSMPIDTNVYQLYFERANSTFSIDRVYLRDSNFETVDDLYPNFITRVYNYTEFDPPGAYFTGNFWDEGLDTDGDKAFDQLKINIEVNITQTGNYYLELRLRSSSSGSMFSSSTSGFWNIGHQNVSVYFDASSFYSQRVNTTYVIEYVYLRDDSYAIIDRLYPYVLTRLYAYDEFDPPGAYLTNKYWDQGLDTDGDGTFDQLIIEIEVNFTQAGVYYLDLRIESGVTGMNYYGSANGFWNIGLQNVSVRFDTYSFYSQRVSTAYVIEYVYIANASYYTMDQMYPYISTQIYNYTEFDLPGAYFTQKYWDYGLDTDADGTFNQLVIEIEVNITQAGDYYLELRLRSVLSSYSFYSSVNDYWNIGSLNVSLSFDATSFYYTRVNTSYMIEYVYLRNASYFTLDRVYPYVSTRLYNYTEFDPPGAYFTENYWDKGFDTNEDGTFNLIVFNVGVNVTLAGDYSVELRLRSNFSGSTYWFTNNSYWNVGLHNFSLSFDVTNLYYQRMNSSFIIEYVSLRNANYTIMDQLDPYFQTRVYNYIEFDPPGAYFTMNYWDRGLDTDADGTFDLLVIDVEVNVTISGDYYLELRLRSNLLGTSFYGSTSGYWNTSVLKISVSFDASSFYYRRVNTSYVIEYIYLRNTSYVTMDRLYPYVSTRMYNFNEFDLPGAYFTENYWDKGLDTNGDGTFDLLIIDVEVNVTLAGDYFLELQITSNHLGYNYYSSTSGYLNTGINNVSLFFDAGSFYYRRVNTSYVIEYVYLRNASYFTMDVLYPYVQTRIYNFTEFDLPDAYFTRNYWDDGLDTDGDGLFNQLIIEVEVNVTKVGFYTLDMQLRSSSGLYKSFTATNNLDIGIQIISAIFDTGEFYLRGISDSYSIQMVEIRDSTYQIIDQVFDTYTTRSYNFLEFDEVDAPIAIFGNAEFANTASIRGWSGDGSSLAPYLIEGLILTISIPFISLIEIHNTDVHFQISNCLISNGYYSIYLNNVKNGFISSNTLVNNNFGIKMQYSDENTITSNLISDIQNTGIINSYSNNNYISYNIFENNGGYALDVSKSNNLNIFKNTLINNANFGINLQGSNNININYNNISNNQAGIVLWTSANFNTISNNIIFDNAGEAIGIHYVNNGNTISENNVYRNGVGINLDDQTANNVINDNFLHDNHGDGIHLGGSYNSVVNNTIKNNEDGIQVSNSNNNDLLNNEISDNSANGILLADFSSSNVIENNHVYNNGFDGISVWENSNNNKITNNLVHTNDRGISAGINGGSRYNTITNNILYDNAWEGIILISAENNTIFENIIYENGLCGIITDGGSSNNLIERNDMRNNSCNTQITDDGLNNAINNNYYENWIGIGPYTIIGTANNQDLSPKRNPNHITGPVFTSPQEQNLSGTIKIEWNNSQDTFGHSLTYTVLYSVDNGNSWIVITSELELTSYSWVLPNLNNGTEIILKIQSTDEIGFQASSTSEKKYVNSLSPISTGSTNTNTTTPGSGFDASLIIMVLSIIFGGGSGVGLAILIQRIKIRKS
ncbi:MAG: right-handed parallel beta-helix repeat-containing protein [Candidatus Hodarchaeales archaeon]